MTHSYVHNSFICDVTHSRVDVHLYVTSLINMQRKIKHDSLICTWRIQTYSYVLYVTYVTIRASMNTWIISSIITNRASDRYCEHSKREYHEPHKDSYDWQDWGLTLEALPPRGGGSAECPKKDRRRVRPGVENKITQNTQINLNKRQLGEP